MTDNPRSQAFGIYLHWPFCQSKCPYCDFNSHVDSRNDEAAFIAALKHELSHFAALSGSETVTSIFFGGGTPSLMSGRGVAALLEHIARLWPLAGDVEISLEANPSSVEAARFADYRAAGVNRISIGVQSLDDGALKRLGRRHNAAEARAAIALAQEAFARVSCDFIYARPGQSLAHWCAELSEILALGLTHLSLYQLTIEPGTPFAALEAAGRLRLPAGDEARALYDLTAELCAGAGLGAYEISNYARPGEECRHNLVYWRYQPYVGVGPGAHGRIGRERGAERLATYCEPDPARWLALVAAQGHGALVCEPLSAEARALEMLLMGLRLGEGLDLGRLSRETGHGLPEALLEELVADGHLERPRPGCIAATEQGRPLLDGLVRMLAEALTAVDVPPRREAPSPTAA